MAINKLEYAKLMMAKLDQQIALAATSGWMEENAGQVIYHGGDEVKIPTISTNGLGNYDRDLGFVQGSITSKYNTYKMTQDRGRTFHIDSMDVDESGFVVNSASVMKEFQTAHVIPEIDAYRYSQIATIAEGANQFEEYTPAAASIVTKLREHIRAVQDVIGDVPLIITLPSAVLGIIEDSEKWSRIVNVADFKQGNVTFKVKSIDDCPIKVVPSNRLYSKIVTMDGESAGQKEGGYKKAEDAKDINWLLTPRNIPLAISKTDKLRVFSPDENQKADAWKIDYRKYHDLWILENKKNNIFACFNKTAAGGTI